MVEFTLQALNDEIENDPQAIGYKEAGGEWMGDQIIADLINLKNLVIDKLSVTMEEIRSAVEYQWYNTLSIDEQEYIKWQTPNGGKWDVSPDMKLQLTGRTLANNGVAGSGSSADSFWAAGSRDLASSKMLALIEADGARAQILWGESKTITASEIGRSANL